MRPQIATFRRPRTGGHPPLHENLILVDARRFVINIGFAKEDGFSQLQLLHRWLVGAVGRWPLGELLISHSNDS